MKTKPAIAVDVTTKYKLTIQGQTFNVTLQELEALHKKIGSAIGSKPEVIHVPVPIGPPRERPFYPPPPLTYPKHPRDNDFSEPYCLDQAIIRESPKITQVGRVLALG